MQSPASWMHNQVISMMSNKNALEETKKLMGALVRMKPKPQEDMKVGKKAKKKVAKKRTPPKRG
jgi:hypothetical protein